MKYAYLSMLCSSFAGISMGALQSAYPLHSVVFFWYLWIALVAFLTILFKRKIPLEIDAVIRARKNVFWIVGAGAVDGICWFASIYLVGLSGTVIIGQLFLVLMILYSHFCYNEKYSKRQFLVMIFIVIAGIMFLSKDFSVGSLAAFSLRMLGSAAFFIFATQQRAMSRRYGADGSLLSLSLRAAVIWVFIAITLFVVDAPNYNLVLDMNFMPLLLLGGLSAGVINHHYSYRAYATEYFSLTQLIKSMGHVVTFLFGALVLNEITSPYYIGLSCIIIMATTWLSINVKSYQK